MATDAERRELFAALEEAVGPAPAAMMMELLPPVGWSDLARQHDITLVRSSMAEQYAELKGDIAAVRGEMAGLRTELKSEMAELRTELKSEMAELRTELRGEIAAVRGEMAGLRTELKGDILQLRAELSAQLPKLYRANFAGAIGLAGLVLAAAKLA